MKNWFVIYCKSNNEARAQQNLLNLGIDSFFPKIIKAKLLRGKKTQVENPLFPNYIFIHADKDSSNFSKIRSTRGVSHFIKFGRSIAEVSEPFIEQLKMMSHCQCIDASELLKVNDEVTINNGPFKGLKAIFAKEDGLERSMLLLNILNKENELSFKNSDISKA